MENNLLAEPDPAIPTLENVPEWVVGELIVARGGRCLVRLLDGQVLDGQVLDVDPARITPAEGNAGI